MGRLFIKCDEAPAITSEVFGKCESFYNSIFENATKIKHWTDLNGVSEQHNDEYQLLLKSLEEAYTGIDNLEHQCVQKLAGYHAYLGRDFEYLQSREGRVTDVDENSLVEVEKLNASQMQKTLQDFKDAITEAKQEISSTILYDLKSVWNEAEQLDDELYAQHSELNESAIKFIESVERQIDPDELT